MKAKEPKPSLDEIEMLPDAWERFEEAVKIVARHPPMHREGKPAAAPAKRRQSKSKES